MFRVEYRADRQHGTPIRDVTCLSGSPAANALDGLVRRRDSLFLATFCLTRESPCRTFRIADVAEAIRRLAFFLVSPVTFPAQRWISEWAAL